MIFGGVNIQGENRPGDDKPRVYLTPADKKQKNFCVRDTKELKNCAENYGNVLSTQEMDTKHGLFNQWNVKTNIQEHKLLME